MNTKEEARKLRDELLPRYIDRLVALDKLDSFAKELWPDIEWYHMVRMVRLGAIAQYNKQNVDVTAIAAALGMERSKCSKFKTKLEKLDYIHKKKVGPSHHIYGTAKHINKSLLYCKEMERLLPLC